METPLFFKNKNYNLFGVLHEPEPNQLNKLNQQNIGIVFCHPFAEEKLIAHRVLVNLARRLTNEGIYCFRFDCMGHGDSDGNFEDSTVETMISDIQCAVDYFKKKTDVEKIGLVGVRFGGALAILSCSTGFAIDFLVLISPIVCGKTYIDQCLRSNLTTQMATYKKIVKDRKQLISDLMNGEPVNIDGYLLSKELYKQIEPINLLKNHILTPENILLLFIMNKENQPIDEKMHALYQKYKTEINNIDLKSIKEDYFWKDNKIYKPYLNSIQEEILNWIRKIYSI